MFWKYFGSSLNLTWQEFKSHKIRTLLSLTGVAFGIFCIISVLATVESLEYQVQKDIKALGTNTVYIDKWVYAGGPDYPWWRYVKRPSPTYEEMQLGKTKSTGRIQCSLQYQHQQLCWVTAIDVINNVNYYGITEEFVNIQPVEIELGRYLQPVDYDFAANVVVMGYTIAETLFGKPEKAVGKPMILKSRQAGPGGRH